MLAASRLARRLVVAALRVLDDFDRAVGGRIADPFVVRSKVPGCVRFDYAVLPVGHLEHLWANVLAKAAADAAFLDPDLADVGVFGCGLGFAHGVRLGRWTDHR